MARQRGELVSVGDALSGMDGPVNPHRDVSPQARHSFTVADQVDRLVSASEADADLGFIARTMALCSLPRSTPGNRLQYKRVNGRISSSCRPPGITSSPSETSPPC